MLRNILLTLWLFANVVAKGDKKHFASSLTLGLEVIINSLF